ncbi:hypothetical protein STSO111631_23815 [Stackebrandtia soli]
MSDMDIATYRPETLRYGTGDTLRAAERLFHADSRTVLHQLSQQLPRRLAVTRDVLTAWNHLHLLHHLNWPQWPEWLLDTIPATSRHTLSRADRKAALHPIDPTHTRPHVLDELTPGLAPTWHGRGDAARAYATALATTPNAPPPATIAADLLHMHANRMHGPDREAEQRSLALLRDIVHSHTARQRHPRRTP